MEEEQEGNIPRVGMLFSSFEKWKSFKEKYEFLVKEVFELSHSHKLPTDKVKKEIPLELKYYEAYYVCKHGIKTAPSQATGERNVKYVQFYAP